jgi:outer membrane protein OmpA-like peptidoglycan-associated protein
VPFAAGRTILGPQGKASLDEMASKLSGEKGYIVEVQGYSRSGVQTSQAMADSVVRYLVTEHQVPLYRIYRTGLGKQTPNPDDTEAAITNGVRVTLLHNSLASMDSSNAPNPQQSSLAPTSAPTNPYQSAAPAATPNQ